MPFVAIKTVEEQDMQALHRMRAQKALNRNRRLLGKQTQGIA
jgi:hypothetical protein